MLNKGEELIDVVKNNVTEEEYVNLKDSLYKLDYWITDVFLRKLTSLRLDKEFDDVVLIPIHGTIRETLL
nr:hypothetical protein [bacterium]